VRKRERERAITNTEDLFRESSILALCPRFQHYEGFSLKMIPQDHSVPQHLQRVHTRTLGLTSPSPCSRKKNTRKHTNLPSCTYSSNHTSEHLVITSLDHHKTLFNTKMKLVITSLDHKNNSHNKASIG